MKRFFVMAGAAVALGAAASGCHSPANGPGSQPTAAVPPAVTSPASPAPNKVVAYVINPTATGDQDQLVPHTTAIRHPKEPAKDALNALLQSSHSPIAPGTSLRGISVDGGLATVDFSRSPVDETGGESGQSAAMNALAMTLGQFSNITTFQIEVKGQPMKSFGEFTTDGPMDVIRPGNQPQAEAAKLPVEGSSGQ